MSPLKLPGEKAVAELGLGKPLPVPDPTAHRFPDGGAFRIEIPSVEGPRALAAALETAEALEVRVHRVSQGSGVMMLTDDEISEMLERCQQARVELCLFLGPRAAWDVANAGSAASSRARGGDQVRHAVADAIRATELGVRCLLVGDEGVLWTLHRLRDRGNLPRDLRLKVSALMGPLNPASFALLERLGADSINVPSHLTLAQLAELRTVSRASIDFYVETPDDLGGFVRQYEAADIVRVAAPIYLKFGLRNAPPVYPSGKHLHDLVTSSARERVRRARLCLDLFTTLSAHLPSSPAGAVEHSPDLVRFESVPRSGDDAS